MAIRIRPSDWKTGKYWLHLALLAVIITGILQLVYGGDMFNIRTILASIPILGISDILVHTILQTD